MRGWRRRNSHEVAGQGPGDLGVSDLGENRADRGLIGRPHKKVGRQEQEQRAPSLTGLQPKSTINRQLETLPADQTAGHLSSLFTLTSSLTSHESEGASEGEEIVFFSPRVLSWE